MLSLTGGGPSTRAGKEVGPAIRRETGDAVEPRAATDTGVRQTCCCRALSSTANRACLRPSLVRVPSDWALSTVISGTPGWRVKSSAICLTGFTYGFRALDSG